MNYEYLGYEYLYIKYLAKYFNKDLTEFDKDLVTIKQNGFKLIDYIIVYFDQYIGTKVITVLRQEVENTDLVVATITNSLIYREPLLPNLLNYYSIEVTNKQLLSIYDNYFKSIK